MRVRLEVETHTGRRIGASVPIANALPNWRQPTQCEFNNERDRLRQAVEQIYESIEKELYG
ncbi:hypothetical protein J4U02_gp134 [Mycobacterium phage Aziz]|uniref:Uncharacterized protein n=1 Tax=Mycobacterium phage Aziz TaxID=2762281 RepID=A0A7G8LHQ6_9CAUD|nr:hypothetical protein J4U02_gp134 [Mycobacterium phage Aziz]ASR75965.1 hypothetical protein SEA_GENEVAB15_143 [Mycobacterium phage GenevaB15]QNJ56778.1 hypothetical protein SEA_AZIZ_140 [Mycobacterium phage Aziz]